MSHLLDLMLTPDNKMDMDLDVDAILPDDMKHIFESNELMSSEFFDSVFSMEKQNMDSGVDFHHDMSDLQSESSSLTSPVHDSIFSETPSTEFVIQANEIDKITMFGKENSETICSGNVVTSVDDSMQHNFSEILGVSGDNQVIIKPATKMNTKQVIITQPGNLKKGTIQSNKKTQLLRIQSVQGSGKPLLLPVNVKSMKKFRVINASDLKVNSIKVLPPMSQTVTNSVYSTTSNDSTDGEMDSSPETTYSNGKYPPLNLTAEEKRLLVKEGITLPTHYPLSKQDEKELKRIRRKIRNKISAQDSRKRKKEYVDQLEEKARRTDEENEILKKRVKLLNRENTRLYEQLKKLQDILFNTSNKATPTTCLMIVLFSTLLVCLPNLKTADKNDLEIADQETVASRRVLLFDQKAREDDDLNLDEFLVLKREESEMHLNEEEKENGTNAFVQYLSDLSKKYESLIRSNCSEILEGGFLQDFCKKHESEFKQVLDNLRSFIDKGGSKEEKKFIEPDISDDEGEVLFKHRNAYLLDDDDPPTKKVSISREMIDYDDDTPIPILEVEIQSPTENNSIPVME